MQDYLGDNLDVLTGGLVTGISGLMSGGSGNVGGGQALSGGLVGGGVWSRSGWCRAGAGLRCLDGGGPGDRSDLRQGHR